MPWVHFFLREERFCLREARSDSPWEAQLFLRKARFGLPWGALCEERDPCPRSSEEAERQRSREAAPLPWWDGCDESKPG